MKFKSLPIVKQNYIKVIYFEDSFDEIYFKNLKQNQKLRNHIDFFSLKVDDFDNFLDKNQVFLQENDSKISLNHFFEETTFENLFIFIANMDFYANCCEKIAGFCKKRQKKVWFFGISENSSEVLNLTSKFQPTIILDSKKIETKNLSDEILFDKIFDFLSILTSRISRDYVVIRDFFTDVESERFFINTSVKRGEKRIENAFEEIFHQKQNQYIYDDYDFSKILVYLARNEIYSDLSMREFANLGRLIEKFYSEKQMKDSHIIFYDDENLNKGEIKMTIIAG